MIYKQYESESIKRFYKQYDIQTQCSKLLAPRVVKMHAQGLHLFAKSNGRYNIEIVMPTPLMTSFIIFIASINIWIICRLSTKQVSMLDELSMSNPSKLLEVLDCFNMLSLPEYLFEWSNWSNIWVWGLLHNCDY